MQYITSIVIILIYHYVYLRHILDRYRKQIQNHHSETPFCFWMIVSNLFFVSVNNFTQIKHFIIIIIIKIQSKLKYFKKRSKSLLVPRVLFSRLHSERKVVDKRTVDFEDDRFWKLSKANNNKQHLMMTQPLKYFRFR